ncbi:MAG: HEAT repeat domain-containing protein [Mariniblastus sp.]
MCKFRSESAIKSLATQDQGLRWIVCASVFVVCTAVHFSGTQLMSSAVAQIEKIERDVYGFVVERDKDGVIIERALGPTDPKGTALLSDTNRLLLRSVQDSNPKTAVELAKAVRIMVDIEQYWDVRYYLSELEKLDLTDDQMFELQRAVGSDLFIELNSLPLVQPEGKQVARKLLRAARKVALTPERIAGLIKVLNNRDISVRSQAFRELNRLGEPAVAELINVFADPNRKSDFPGVRGALKSIDPSAQGPLLGAARASNPLVQVEAVRALSNFKTSESLDVMMRAYLSPKMPEYTRRIALDALTRNKLPADPGYIEKTLYERSRDYLLGKRLVPGAVFGDVSVWEFDSKTKRMVSKQVGPDTAIRVLASRRASDLYEIRPDLARNREMYLLTQLEAAKRVVGPSQKVDVDSIVAALKTDASEIENTLKSALKLELIPAAISCCEILEKIGSSEQLVGSTSKQRPLVEAILFGDRYLQFAAMQAIASIDPMQAYPGSSYMVSLAVYLAQSQNQPAGLVGHVREDVAQTYAATLSSAGVFGTAVSSGREFFLTATSNPDIDMLVVTDTLTKPSYGELIQQLRNDWRTRRLPIAFLYRDANHSRRIKMRLGDDPRFTSIPFSSDPEMVATHIGRLNEKSKPWTLTNFDRRRHASAAVGWLAKISASRDDYPFYNLGIEQNQLARLLYLPGFANDASQILSKLGTPTAQRELVNFASQSGLPLKERQNVVEAFAESVKTGGTLLTTKEIQQQYDRYNASRNEPEELQSVLGSILDVIEAQRGGSSE